MVTRIQPKQYLLPFLPHYLLLIRMTPKPDGCLFELGFVTQKHVGHASHKIVTQVDLNQGGPDSLIFGSMILSFFLISESDSV